MTDATRFSPATAASGTSSRDQIASGPSPGDVWPVYKGTSFNLWEPDTGVYYDSVDAVSIATHLHQKRLSQSHTSSSAFAELSELVLRDRSTLPCRHARIAFRDVARSTDTRTIVAALIPADRVMVHQAPYLLRTTGSVRDEAYVLGVLSSMPCDWQSRRTVELHVTFEQLSLLTIPDPGQGNPVRDRVVEIAGCLAAVDERLEDWAVAVGVPVGSANDPQARADLMGELDACVAHIYGLDEDDLAVLYGTFDAKRPDRYADHHDGVLAHFRRLTP